jgi:hypothetical protein
MRRCSSANLTRGSRLNGDVKYGPGERNRLDVFMPEVPSCPRPVLIFGHAAVAPRPASSGPMPLTTGHGAAPIRRASSMSMLPDRKAERPIAHLDGFKGILQVDGYAGYRKLAERGDIQLAFCWSHMRRNFYELATPGPAPIASEALERIAEFYAIEKDIRGRSAEERHLIRQQKSQPLAKAFEQWLRAKLALIVTGMSSHVCGDQRARG